MTSFNAFPAICLCLFFMCDVFFFGTALRTDSHISSSNEGIDGRLSWKEAGIARTNEGKRGRESCRVKAELSLGVGEAATGKIRDSRDEPAGSIRRDGAANAILKVFRCLGRYLIESSWPRTNGRVVARSGLLRFAPVGEAPS